MHLPAHRQTARASTLVVAVFVIVLVGTLIQIALTYTSQTGLLGKRSRNLVAAQALAEGGLEVAFKRWQTYMIRTGGSQVPGVQDLNGSVINPSDIITRLNNIPGHAGYTLQSVRVVPVDRQDNEIQDNSPLSAMARQAMAARVPVPNQPGWSGTAYSYRAQAVVSSDSDLDGNGQPVRIVVSRYFQKVQSSLFQAMLFFQDDLELHPGPNMTLYGLVHTNSNLYACAGNGGGLTFNSNVSFTGNADTLNPAANALVDSRGYAEGVTQTLYQQESGNWGSYKNPVYSTGKSSQVSQVSSLDPLGSSAANAVPANQQNDNTSGLHELIERPVANQTDPDAYATHRVFGFAGLRITINRNDPTRKVRIYGPDTTDPTWSTDYRTDRSVEIVPTGNAAPKAGKPDLRNIADLVLTAIAPSTGTAAANGSGTGEIRDFREGREVNLDTIDLSKLTPILNNYDSYNGIIHVSDITHASSLGESSNFDAIRLLKGGVAPDDGITIVSDGAVYVQGDFNTGTTYKADVANAPVQINKQPNSNTLGDTTQYTVAGYTQKPCAVMGDAVMILSNAWTDANGHASMSSRNATPTTFNAAILSGQVLTDDSTASGGAHNFPRFLEDWSGDNFTYYGSMCELYPSKHFTGTYGKSNVYSPPVRRWFFDNAFLTNPPPGSVTSTTYSRGRWVRY